MGEMELKNRFSFINLFIHNIFKNHSEKKNGGFDEEGAMGGDEEGAMGGRRGGGKMAEPKAEMTKGFRMEPNTFSADL